MELGLSLWSKTKIRIFQTYLAVLESSDAERQLSWSTLKECIGRNIIPRYLMEAPKFFSFRHPGREKSVSKSSWGLPSQEVAGFLTLCLTKDHTESPFLSNPIDAFFSAL